MQLQGTYKEILQLSIPIMFSSLSWNIIALTDNYFLGNIGKTELGAIAIASIFYVCLMTITMGFSRAVQVMISRNLGEKKTEEAGNIFDQSLFTGLGVFVVMFFISQFTSQFILKYTLRDADVLAACNSFLKYRIIGLPFEIYAMIFTAFFNGIARNKIIITYSILTTLANILFNYILVLGNLGAPKMGMSGSGLASALAQIVGFLVMLIYIYQDKFRKPYFLFRWRGLDMATQKEMILLALPFSGQMLIALVSWLSFFIFIENTGKDQLAISNLLKGVYMFFCIPVWSLSSVTNTIISNFVGQRRGHEIFKIAHRIIKVALAFMVISTICLLLFSEQLYSLFTDDLSLVQGAKQLNWILYICFFIFPFSTIYFNVIVALEDGKAALMIEFINVSIYLGYLFIVSKILHGTITSIWCAEFFYWTTLLVCSGVYFKYLQGWKKYAFPTS